MLIQPARRRRDEVVQRLRDHRGHAFVGAQPDALVFAGPKGAPLRRSNFQKYWRQGLDAASLSGVHFHDLRHTGNTLAAQAGATMSDLMARMGHASTRAAQTYLRTAPRNVTRSWRRR